MFLRAVRTEFIRSFEFSGRTARRHYLTFLATSISAMSVCLALLAIVLPSRHVAIGMYLTVAIFYLPVTSAGVRRLHDVWESGTLMLDPLKPAFCFTLLLLGVFVAGTYTASGQLILFLTAWFFASAVIAIGAILLVICACLTLAYFSNTMGLLLLPSQPGPNKYGPNPNEVL